MRLLKNNKRREVLVPKYPPYKITAWSYSRWSCFNKCRKQFKLKFIDKLPTEDNYAASRGGVIHAKAEQFVKGNIKGVPKELKQFRAEFNEIKRLCAETEVDVSVTKAWTPTHTKDWNGVWCRGFIDAAIEQYEIANLIDYKTGKKYEEAHKQQGDIYAPLYFSHHPTVQAIDIEMWYLDEYDVLPMHYERDKDYERLMKYWNKEATKIFRETKFPADPGYHCRWCDFRDICEEAE